MGAKRIFLKLEIVYCSADGTEFQMESVEMISIWKPLGFFIICESSIEYADLGNGCGPA